MFYKMYNNELSIQFSDWCTKGDKSKVTPAGSSVGADGIVLFNPKLSGPSCNKTII